MCTKLFEELGTFTTSIIILQIEALKIFLIRYINNHSV